MRRSKTQRRWLGWGIGLLVILGLMGISLISYQRTKRETLAQQRLVSENLAQRNHIIAPAIIDSLADVTKIPALQSGVIKKIHVKLGQHVKKGDVLFELDHRLTDELLQGQKVSLQQAEKNIWIQTKQWRHLKRQLTALTSLDRKAISRLELNEKRHEVILAKARLQQAYNEKKLTEANVKQTELTLKQFNVTAPKAGIVLQINAHRNEFISLGQPVISLGDANRVIVRVSIDEREAYRFRQNAPSHLINYGDERANIPMKFMQIDQYIVVQERLNTRVQEVLYSFERKGHEHLIAGQLFDAYIDLS